MLSFYISVFWPALSCICRMCLAGYGGITCHNKSLKLNLQKLIISFTPLIFMQGKTNSRFLILLKDSDYTRWHPFI